VAQNGVSDISEGTLVKPDEPLGVPGEVLVEPEGALGVTGKALVKTRRLPGEPKGSLGITGKISSSPKEPLGITNEALGSPERALGRPKKALGSPKTSLGLGMEPFYIKKRLFLIPLVGKVMFLAKTGLFPELPVSAILKRQLEQAESK